MTRFARAKGSKASNEKNPEEATSWLEMKQQLEQKRKEIEENKHRKEINETKMKNYKTFLEEKEKNVQESWAEFPEVSILQRKEKVVKNVQEKKQKVVKSVAKRKENVVTIPQTKEKVNANVTEKKEKVVKKKEKILQSVPKKIEKAETITKPGDWVVENISENGDLKINPKDVKRKKLVKNDDDVSEQPNKKKQKKNKTNLKIDNEIKASKNLKFANRNHKFSKMKNIKPETNSIFINGENVQVVTFDGFPILKDDANRLKSLRKEMISKGLPSSEIKYALKMERRRAEKALQRVKKQVCFQCRQAGHTLSNCPNVNNMESITSGVCFKCGSTEHTHFQCKVVKNQEFRFATCFICKEQGHIARQCPDNARGLYPKGGACKLCGDVTHLKKDCPKYVAEQEAATINLDRIGNDNIEGLENIKKDFVKNKPKQKVVVF